MTSHTSSRETIDSNSYEMIDSNYYHSKRKSLTKDSLLSKCVCCTIQKPGERICFNNDCFDYGMQTECVDCDSHCGNMRFQKREYANVVVKHTSEKGRGLFSIEDIDEKQFIIEYVGEVINKTERSKREDSDYVMDLKDHTFVDAHIKGNVSRFINHSCEPNCIAEVWSVKGKNRAGIFALKAISAETELTMDYGWTSPTPMIPCFCGSRYCRGYVDILKPTVRKTMNSGDSALDRLFHEGAEQSRKISHNEAEMNKDIELASLLKEIVHTSKECRELQTQSYKVSKDLDVLYNEVGQIKRDRLDKYYKICVDTVSKCRGTYDRKVAKEGHDKFDVLVVQMNEKLQNCEKSIEELTEKQDELKVNVNRCKDTIRQSVEKVTNVCRK